jgi:hypothetical protein
MSCKSCQSANRREFPAEINVHFPGSRNLTKPAVWLFPKLLVCLDCGFVEFAITDAELRRLRSPDFPADVPRGRHG